MTAGGRWYGVKSIRPMLPWGGFPEGELARTLEHYFDPDYRNRVLRSAMEFVRRERDK